MSDEITAVAAITQGSSNRYAELLAVAAASKAMSNQKLMGQAAIQLIEGAAAVMPNASGAQGAQINLTA